MYLYMSRLGLYAPSLVEGVDDEPVVAIEADRTDDGPPTFDGRHGMRTRAMLRAADRTVAGQTEVWGHDGALGAVGRVWVLLATRSGYAVARVSPTRRTSGPLAGNRVARAAVAYPLVSGVSPTFWTANVPDELPERVLAGVTRLEIVHATGPAGPVEDVIDRGIRDRQTVEEIVAAVAALPRS